MPFLPKAFIVLAYVSPLCVFYYDVRYNVNPRSFLIVYIVCVMASRAFDQGDDDGTE